jgi:hypothetical protein
MLLLLLKSCLQTFGIIPVDYSIKLPDKMLLGYQ